jgi:hypothetical protein
MLLQLKVHTWCLQRVESISIGRSIALEDLSVSLPESSDSYLIPVSTKYRRPLSSLPNRVFPSRRSWYVVNTI